MDYRKKILQKMVLDVFIMDNFIHITGHLQIKQKHLSQIVLKKYDAAIFGFLFERNR